MSVVVRGAWPWPGALSLVAGLAVLDAARAVAGGDVPLAVDWPNDVVWRAATVPSGGPGAPLVEAPKVAGILIEGRLGAPDPAAAADAAYVVGIGVNVRGALGPALRAERPVATLAELGLDTTPEALGAALHAALAERIAPLATGAKDGPAFDTAARTVCSAYLAAAGLALGAPARVAVHGGGEGPSSGPGPEAAGEAPARTLHEGVLRAFGPAGLTLEPTNGTSPGALRHVPLEHVAGLAPVY